MPDIDWGDSMSGYRCVTCSLEPGLLIKKSREGFSSMPLQLYWTAVLFAFTSCSDRGQARAADGRLVMCVSTMTAGAQEASLRVTNQSGSSILCLFMPACLNSRVASRSLASASNQNALEEFNISVEIDGFRDLTIQTAGATAFYFVTGPYHPLR